MGRRDLSVAGEPNPPRRGLVRRRPIGRRPGRGTRPSIGRGLRDTLPAARQSGTSGGGVARGSLWRRRSGSGPKADDRVPVSAPLPAARRRGPCPALVAGTGPGQVAWHTMNNAFGRTFRRPSAHVLPAGFMPVPSGRRVACVGAEVAKIIMTPATVSRRCRGAPPPGVSSSPWRAPGREKMAPPAMVYTTCGRGVRPGLGRDGWANFWPTRGGAGRPIGGRRMMKKAFLEVLPTGSSRAPAQVRQAVLHDCPRGTECPGKPSFFRPCNGFI